MSNDKPQYNTARDILKVIAIIATVLRKLHDCHNVLLHRQRTQTYKIRVELCIASSCLGNDI